MANFGSMVTELVGLWIDQVSQDVEQIQDQFELIPYGR